MTNIERLDATRTADVDAVAALHAEHLADSPVVQFGRRFMRRFYYRKLVEAGLVGCSICRLDGRVVGFISYTLHPLDFMTRGMRRWLPYLAWLLGTSVLARPALLRDLFQVWRLMRERGDEASSAPAPGVGEVLSLVVLPEYRNRTLPGSRTRVTGALFEDMVEYFRAADYERVYLLVQPANTASNLFCAAMGCDFEKIVTWGRPTHRYTYRLRPESVGARAADE